MRKGVRGRGFNFPNLPKNRYLFLQAARDSLATTQWHVLCAALDSLAYLKTYAPDVYAKLTADVLAEFPPKVSGEGDASLDGG